MVRFYFEYNGKKLWIDNLLRFQLDSCIFNIKISKTGDWDIMIIITGDRMVRTGKSTLAQLIGAYFSYRLGVPYTIKDLYFDSKKMVCEAINKPKFSINHYDEAKRALSVTKRMKDVQGDLIDYYAESGQLNQINLIILPDFFDLKEEIAVARSEFLLNVYRGEEKIMKDIYQEGQKIPIVKWSRGFFSFFNRTGKAILYDRYRSNHAKNYFSTPANFNGAFEDFDIIPKVDYAAAKLEALKDYQNKEKEKHISLRDEKYKTQRNQLILMASKLGASDDQIAKYLGSTMHSIRNLRYDIIKEQEIPMECEV